jgi:hypothetical protein
MGPLYVAAGDGCRGLVRESVSWQGDWDLRRSDNNAASRRLEVVPVDGAPRPA